MAPRLTSPDKVAAKHVASPVFDEEDYGNATFCGVFLSDHSAVPLSQRADATCRLCLDGSERA